MRSDYKKVLTVSIFTCLIICFFAAVLFVQPVPAETSQLTPDWTGVTYDFFNLSQGAVEPVLTAADVTDRVANYVADPFIYHEGDTWYMFFEIDSSVGTDIGLATSSDGFNWTYQQVVLDESFPLAYASVFKWNGTYYMLPESYTQNEIRLYKATNFPYDWTFVNALVSGRQYVDPSIFRYNNTWWMYAPTTAFTTYLFYSDNLTDPGSWHEHPMSPVVYGDASKARGGGRPIVFNGSRVIRLAQKCDVSYGEAVRAFEVDTLTKTSYAEQEIPQSPIVEASGSGWNRDGMHHIDPWWIGNRWLVAVDGRNIESGEVWSIGIYVSPVAFYQLTISTKYGTASPSSGVFDAGSTVTITATPPAAASGERYVWLGWAGSGNGSYTGSDNPASVTMNGPVNQTASWKHEYYLTVTSAHSSPTPSAWVDAGGDFNASVTSPTETVPRDNQWICAGFSIDGGAYQAGTAYTFTNVQAAHSIVFAWKQQFWFQVNSSHGSSTTSQWIDKGDNLTVSVTSPADDDGMGTRYRCTGWNGTASVPTNGTSTSVTFTINAPSTLTWNWIAQYYLTTSTDFGSVSPSSNWYDAGTEINMSATPPNANPNERYVWTGWIGAGTECYNGKENPAPLIINHPTSETASWKLQFQVVFQRTGLSEGVKANVIVNSVNHTLPYSDWFDQGSTITFAYEEQVPGGFGTRYILASASEQSPLTVESSINVTGHYDTYYTTETIVFISAIIVLGGLAIAIIFLKKRKPNSLTSHG